MTNGNRFIVCAAIKDKNEIVICGARHFDQIMIKQIETNNLFDTTEIIQGFIDQYGHFLDRKESLLIATHAKQINIRRPKSNPEDELFSEDLY